MMRIYKVLKVSKESKQWPFGSYPPKLQKAASIEHNRVYSEYHGAQKSVLRVPWSTKEYTDFNGAQ